jgi:hypothetical protein
MIVTKMIGGIGNQMFQYAAGKALALKNNTELIIDNSTCVLNKTHGYDLDIFRLDARVMTPPEISAINAGDNTKHKITGPKDSAPPVKGLDYYKQEKFGYNGQFENIGNGTYIEGYWQSEKYFLKIKDVIRHDFTFIHPATGRNAGMLDSINSENSVSLHIRRGDYFDNWRTRLFHGVDLKAYYKKAVRTVKEYVPNPCFYIFSDDPGWVKENFKAEHEFRIVDCNDSRTGYEDLRLMSNCKHNIICNSTFSWWGAWLNNNENKTVTAPKKWFNNPFVNTSDIIPDAWVKL